MSLHPGKQVSASLRLVRMLGRGAMGSVWLADHLTLQSQVAVKFMAPAMAEDPISVQRFQQEAKAAAEIRSPHVAQVFDHGKTSDGQLFIVMELLEGQSLEKRVRDAGALRPSEVVRVVSHMCKALAKAHERGIVHRDIKPSNVFIIDSGSGEQFIKLLDFGVAKFSGEEAMNMTAAGNMVGTPAFMSPEQLFHGKDTDHRGDLWSVGVVAYFALTGVRPFQGKTLGELAVQIKGASFRMPSELRTDLPPDVDAWFARALHGDLAQRFTSAKDMATALERACGVSTMMSSTPSGVAHQLQTFPGTSLSSPSVTVPVLQPRRWPIGVGIAGALLVGGVVAVFVLAPRSSAPLNPAPNPVTAASAPNLPLTVVAPDVADVDEVVPPVPLPVAPPSAAAEDASAEPASTDGSPPPTAPRSTPPPRPPDPKQDDRLKSAADRLGI